MTNADPGAATGAARDPTGDAGSLDSLRGLATAILLGVIGAEVFIVQPGFVQGLVQHLHFDEAQANFVASADMFGTATVTVALIFLAHRLDWRRTLYASIAVMAVANIACTFVRDLETFWALRYIAGLGAGGLVSLSFTAIGLTRDTDRNFGWLIVWVLSYGAVVLVAMPSVFDRVGMTGVLWFFAAFPLVALPFVRHMPRQARAAAQVERDAVDLPGRLRVSALAGMFAYYLAQGAVWANLFLVGVATGIDEQAVANGLTASQFAGVAGAFVAVLLAARVTRTAAIFVGTIAGAVVLYPLVGAPGAVLYAVVVCVYNFAWNYVQPIQLGAMASFDRRGRVVVHAVAAQMCGLAGGPFLAGLVIGDGAVLPVMWLGIGLFILSALLFLPPTLAQRRMSHGATST
jgi:predicted MFS family arabinose efflux permease